MATAGFLVTLGLGVFVPPGIQWLLSRCIFYSVVRPLCITLFDGFHVLDFVLSLKLIVIQSWNIEFKDEMFWFQHRYLCILLCSRSPLNS